MPRLFVAIDLPADIKSELSGLLPAVEGLRPVNREQLHLTLHFLGECELQPVLAALLPIRFAPFAIALEGVGEFRQRGGDRILWAGVRTSHELQQIHAELARALKSVGYQPDERPYTPHITLVRGRPTRPRSAPNDFVLRHANWRSREFPVTEFRLISSTLTPRGSIYRCEQTFPSRTNV